MTIELLPARITGIILRDIIMCTIQRQNKKIAATSAETVTKYLSELIWSASPRTEIFIDSNFVKIE
jgi:hypothetical protein